MNKKNLIKLMNALPNGFNNGEVERLRTALVAAENTSEIREIERELFATTMSWGKPELGFYDAEILGQETARQRAVNQMDKYEQLIGLMERARAAYEDEQRATIEGYETRQGQATIDREIAEGRLSTETNVNRTAAETAVQGAEERIQAISDRIAALNAEIATGEASYLENAKERFLIEKYAQEYRDSFKGLFKGIQLKKFNNLPESEQARVIEAFKNAQGTPYIQFNTADSNGHSAEETARQGFDRKVKTALQPELDTLLAQLPAAKREVITAKYGLRKTDRAITDLNTEIADLTTEIEHLGKKLEGYHAFVKLNFEDRAEIIGSAADAYGENFATSLINGDITAMQAFDRATRLMYANRDLAELEERSADFENLTEADYFAKYGEHHATTLLQIATLSGYVDMIEGQARLATSFPSRIEDPALRAVIERDLGRDDFDYMDRAFSHYYQAGYAALPNQDVTGLDKGARKLFGKHVNITQERLAYERQRAIIAQRNFQNFATAMLDPVVVGYTPDTATTTKVDELMAEKLAMLSDRKEEVLTAKSGTITRPSPRRSIASTTSVVTVDKTIVKDIDMAMSHGVVSRYTQLTMIREDLARKDPLTPEDRRVLQEVSTRLQATIEEATQQGLLTDLVEANKVAIETMIPGYDKLRAFAEAKGIDLTDPAQRDLLKTPEMQAEFDAIFKEDPLHQPENIVTELQTFIESDEKLRASTAIEYSTDGKPYIVNYKLDADGKRVIDASTGKPVQDGRFPLTNELLSNTEFLATFGFNPDMTAVVVEQPVNHQIEDILAERDRLVIDPTPGVVGSMSFYGQVDLAVGLTDVEANFQARQNATMGQNLPGKKAEIEAVFDRFTSGKSSSLYKELLAVQRKYYEETFEATARVDAEAETYVENVTREGKMKEVLEDKKVGSTKSTGKQAREKTVEKKLEAIGTAIEAFKEGPSNTVTEDILDQAVATAFAGTLAYLSRYDLDAEALARVNEAQEAAGTGFSIDYVEVQDPNDPNKTISKPELTRTTEDGTTYTYTVGEDNKIDVRVEEPAQEQA